MSESGDFDPGPWRGHDFKEAYADYDRHVGRSYRSARSAGRHHTDLVEPRISTNCTNPLVIWCDITGSMGEWPKVIFSKLPYLDLEAKVYLGDDNEIAFGAVGDAQNGDTYPLQIRGFSRGPDLKNRMEELVIEGGGGPGLQESYELAALYSLHNISIPNAIRPVLVLIADEAPFEQISPEMAKSVAGVALQGAATTAQVFEQLRKKFAVYLIRKPYRVTDGNDMSHQDIYIRSQWVSLLGDDHIVDLPDPARVVDVTFGILARETGRIPYFRKEIEGRQREDQVSVVYKSLATVHRLPAPEEGAVGSGNSIVKLPPGMSPGGVSRRLLT